MSRATAIDFGDDVLVSNTDTQKPTPSIFSRMYAAVLESRQRQADREIEQFINRQGGMLTDSMEREISRRYGTLAG